MTNKMQLTFFNTINLSGEELKGARESCNRQEERILEIMKNGWAYTPFEIYELYKWKHPKIPITSIRRCMTVLTKKGKLEKLDEMKEGAFGKPNHKWRIKV